MIYLNNATFGFPCSPAALAALMQSLGAPPADVRHVAPVEAAVERARWQLAGLLGAPVETLFFTPDATTALNLVLQGYPSAGKTVLVDNRPHNAVNE